MLQVRWLLVVTPILWVKGKRIRFNTDAPRNGKTIETELCVYGATKSLVSSIDRELLEYWEGQRKRHTRPP